MTDEELYILCHAYEALSSHSNDKQNYKLALDQLCKAHECLLDISHDSGGNNSTHFHTSLLSYIKGI